LGLVQVVVEDGEVILVGVNEESRAFNLFHLREHLALQILLLDGVWGVFLEVEGETGLFVPELPRLGVYGTGEGTQLQGLIVRFQKLFEEERVFWLGLLRRFLFFFFFGLDEGADLDEGAGGPALFPASGRAIVIDPHAGGVAFMYLEILAVFEGLEFDGAVDATAGDGDIIEGELVVQGQAEVKNRARPHLAVQLDHPTHQIAQ